MIAFGQSDGMRQTVLLPVEEVKAVSVNVGHRSKGALFQGGLMVVAAVFFYVLLAYWLTGRIDGPTVPIIRMDLVAFVVFLAVLTGVALLAQIYFAKGIMVPKHSLETFSPLFPRTQSSSGNG